jgi:hypothetical protein
MKVGDFSLDQDIDRGDQVDEALMGTTRAIYANLQVFWEPASVISRRGEGLRRARLMPISPA